MSNDFYDIDMMQTINNLAKEMDKKNESREKLYNEYQINKAKLEKLYKNDDKQLEDEAYKILDSASKKGAELEICSTFSVKDLGEIIAKFLTDIDTRNRKFYFKQIKVKYKEEDYNNYNRFYSNELFFYNAIAYDDINEDAIYSFKELNELTCFEYCTYNYGNYKQVKIYNLFVQESYLSAESSDKIKLYLNKNDDFTLKKKINAFDLRCKIIEFVDTLINYRIYHELENITKEELENFEQEYVLKYNKIDDNSRKLTK